MTTASPAPPTEPPMSPTPPTPAPSRSRSPLAALLTGLAVGAGVVGGAWVITANQSPDKPAAFTLEGTFTLNEDAVDIDGDCAGTGGYDDIAEGTSVTVYGASGDVIATGRLGESKPGSYGTCTYAVAVDDVPKGEKFYKVEVSHRGTLQLSAKEAENGKLASSLG
ncbi:hypothetical protein [Streptomyces sp. NPDC055060]